MAQLTSLFETPTTTSPMTIGMGGQLNISVRKNTNGAVVSISGLGANQEFSVERGSTETDTQVATRVKAIIVSALEV